MSQALLIEAHGLSKVYGDLTALADADYLVLHPATLTGEAIRQAQHLKLIQLLAAGYDQGFTDMDEAVKEYVTFLDNGGYYEYGK